LGGVINVALNSRPSGAGSVSFVPSSPSSFLAITLTYSLPFLTSFRANTYIVFIALTAVSPFFALLLSEPHQVVRDDRTKVTVGTSKLGFRKEMKEVWKVLLRREVLFL